MGDLNDLAGPLAEFWGEPPEQVAKALRRRMQDLEAEQAADPDGWFDQVLRVLLLKRGCRR